MARPTARQMALVLPLICLAGFAVACGTALGGAIPVEQFKDTGAPISNEYVIAVGDVLSVQVWEQAQMSGRMRVRSDGRITIPLINDVEAAGKTPAKLSADLEASLTKVVRNPKVTIVVEESKPPTISVLGEVGKPGAVPLERETGVAEAIAAAGGLSTFAHKDRIFVVRSEPTPVRIHFTYEALTQSVGAAATFRLRPGDIIVVE